MPKIDKPETTKPKTKKQDKEEISAISPNPTNKPSWYSLGYDILMMIAITIDLLFILIDNVLMSDALRNFGVALTNYLNVSLLSELVNNYAQLEVGFGISAVNEAGFEWFNHANISVAGGFFTIFLIWEILIRWGFAIVNKTYYRWFFFPFVHWYEVISCFPQLRVFRLLRAVAIGRRLHQMGYKVLPKRWLKTIQFYYGIVLEELSDRVLLTATANIRSQLDTSIDSQALIKKTVDNNRENIEAMIVSMLRTELAPRLRKELIPTNANSPVATHVGLAIRDAVAKTPEINAVLRKIPIAGSMIESQIMGISEKVGYNIADSVSARLLNDEVLDELFTSIAYGISQIDTTNPALEALIADIIKESLDAFEAQIKTQQWQHHEEMSKIHL